MPTPRDPSDILADFIGWPIIVKSARARLRAKHMLSWGIVTFVLTAFVCLIVYLTTTERGLATVEEAATGMVIPIIIIQAVILMLLGTGAVASGMSIEREKGLLDYQRMTPIRPTGKIVGYMLGLPVREYFLFSLTLPFLAFAVLKSNLSIWTMLHFYAVFFTSVWVYHMTGLVAGMASSKPRFASMTSQGMVVLLYFVLPYFTYFGMTFFEFLTIRPTLFGMIGQELQRMDSITEIAFTSRFPSLDDYRSVPFYSLFLHPTVYTILVQSFLLLTMFSVVFRKWKDEFAHPFSKLFGAFLYAGTIMFALGSLWPHVANDEAFASITRFDGALSELTPGWILWLFMTLLCSIAGVMALLVIHFTTPNKHTIVKGVRLARKRGRNRVPFNSDAATSAPLAFFISAVGIGAGTALFALALRQEYFIGHAPPLLLALAPIVWFAAIVLFIQGFRERFGARIFLVGLFVLWVIPIMTSLLALAAYGWLITGAYLAIPCPPAGFVEIISTVFDATGPINGEDIEYTPPELASHMNTLTAISVGLYVALAAWTQVSLRAHRKRLYAIATAAPDEITTDLPTPDQP